VKVLELLAELGVLWSGKGSFDSADRFAGRESVGCALDDRVGEDVWIGGTTEVVPFPVVLYSGLVVEANSGFLHLPSLTLRAAVGMTGF